MRRHALARSSIEGWLQWGPCLAHTHKWGNGVKMNGGRETENVDYENKVEGWMTGCQRELDIPSTISRSKHNVTTNRPRNIQVDLNIIR